MPGKKHKMGDNMKKILGGIWGYVKDWRNLLTHSLIGVAILAVAFFMPVQPVYRVLLLAAVIAFNLIRMNHAKRFLNQG